MQNKKGTRRGEREVLQSGRGRDGFGIASEGFNHPWERAECGASAGRGSPREMAKFLVEAKLGAALGRRIWGETSFPLLLKSGGKQGSSSRVFSISA